MCVCGGEAGVTIELFCDSSIEKGGGGGRKKGMRTSDRARELDAIR